MSCGWISITSADSGIFIINSIASQGKSIFPKWQSVSWGAMLAVLASVVSDTVKDRVPADHPSDFYGDGIAWP